MNDLHPVDPTLEDRLRSTLVAEADRHPVTPDVEGLRARGDHTMIDLRLPPRRNRARMVAAAVVLAVLAAGAGVAISHAGDEGEPVIADVPSGAPTGWYLPSDGWEVTSVDTGGYPVTPGFVRGVLFMAEDGTGFPQASVTVHRATDPAVLANELVPGLISSEPGDGEDPGQTTWFATGSGGTAPSADLATLRGDLVLHVATFGMAEQDIRALADEWWESGGEALPTPAGQRRVGDATDPDAPAAASEEVLAGLGEGAMGHLALTATVVVRSADGEERAYTLAPPSHRRVPTGVAGADEAVRAGLTPDEVPRTVR